MTDPWSAFTIWFLIGPSSLEDILVVILVSSGVVRLELLVALQQNLRRWHNDQSPALPRKELTHSDEFTVLKLFRDIMGAQALQHGGSEDFTDVQCSAFNNRFMGNGRRVAQWFAVERHTQSED
ncbi:hypothetical protein HPB49_015482 [Dermacentor silvarum]|uniref:Uncharacterized protein n=1 Tax=Dermacentor silvarum TaxID=543639 RepID=A0ACB8DE93_DERSI|nr:hypothetical protein HPB49_015482 [Dermacentor silvarum]